MTKISAYFYPRPPRGGRPTTPTRSVRRTYFYPRPPRGGRLAGYHGGHRDGGISIHALREEGDDDSAHLVVDALLFLSTPSARRATVIARRGVVVDVISIHALREEGDHPSAARSLTSSRFLSTPSARRATTSKVNRSVNYEHFYPRPPRGGRRGCPRLPFRGPRISIHALREEGDRRGLQDHCHDLDFYPRPPRGGRHALAPFIQQAQGISIHALREEGDYKYLGETSDDYEISIHALREEGDFTFKEAGE